MGFTDFIFFAVSVDSSAFFKPFISAIFKSRLSATKTVSLGPMELTSPRPNSCCSKMHSAIRPEQSKLSIFTISEAVLKRLIAQK
ncbi:hypothetical protein D9M71_714910 [compost metagenome]